MVYSKENIQVINNDGIAAENNLPKISSLRLTGVYNSASIVFLFFSNKTIASDNIRKHH